MNSNIKRWMGATICCFIIGNGGGIMAQEVVFPQTQQAGLAQLNVSGDEYLLKTICSPPNSSSPTERSSSTVATK